MRDANLMKMNGSLVANPDVADPPAITIPEPLPLPDAGFAVAGIDDVRRAAAIVAGRIIPWAVIAVLRGDRAADDGAAKQSGRDACRDTALRMGGSRDCHGRNGQCGGGTERHQCLLHGLTFLVGALSLSRQKFHISLE